MPSALVSKTLAAKRAAKGTTYTQAGMLLQQHKTSLAQLSPRGPLSPGLSQQSMCSAMRRCPSAETGHGDRNYRGSRMPFPPREQMERFGSSDSDAWGSELNGDPVQVIGSWGSFQSSYTSSAPDMHMRTGLYNMGNVAAHLQTFPKERSIHQQYDYLARAHSSGHLPSSPPLHEQGLPFAINILAAGSSFDPAARNTGPCFEPTPFAHLEPINSSLSRNNSEPSPASAGFGTWGSPAHSPVLPQAPLFSLPQWEAAPTSGNIDLSGVRAIWETPLCGPQGFISDWSVSQVAN